MCQGVILSLKRDLEEELTSLLVSAPPCPAALLCACTGCLQTNYTCETDGACMVSIFNLDGTEHHVRTCIPKVELVPAGKPFYCLSSEDLRNTHCCYTDFCNKIDLRVPSGERAVLALPFLLLCSFSALGSGTVQGGSGCSPGDDEGWASFLVRLGDEKSHSPSQSQSSQPLVG